MNESQPQLRILDGSRLSRDLDLVTELFHRVNRIIPENQRLLVLDPQMLARDAIGLLKVHGYSQAPVLDRGRVLGVFSFRSFALRTAAPVLSEITHQKCAPGELPVEEYLEQFSFARVTEDMSPTLEVLQRDGGVLVGTDDNLQGILTAADFLRYFHRVASPFVMISEIELALRALIRQAVTEDELRQCIKRSVMAPPGKDLLPKTLEDMTFDNYKMLIVQGENWPSFEKFLGVSRNRTSAKLEEVRQLRNDVFHFRRSITLIDHERLAAHRDWLLLKVKQAELRQQSERPT